MKKTKLKKVCIEYWLEDRELFITKTNLRYDVDMLKLSSNDDIYIKRNDDIGGEYKKLETKIIKTENCILITKYHLSTDRSKYIVYDLVHNILIEQLGCDIKLSDRIKILF